MGAAHILWILNAQFVTVKTVCFPKNCLEIQKRSACMPNNILKARDEQ